MASGIKPSDEALKQFEALKGQKLDYIIYTIEKNSIGVHKVFPESEDDVKAKEAQKKDGTSFSEFKTRAYDGFQELMQGDMAKTPCFAVMDFRFPSDDGDRTKVVFMQWCPDKGAPVKAKMLLASSADAFKQKLNGVHAKLQLSSVADFDYDNIKSMVPEK